MFSPFASLKWVNIPLFYTYWVFSNFWLSNLTFEKKDGRIRLFIGMDSRRRYWYEVNISGFFTVKFNGVIYEDDLYLFLY